MTAHITGPKAPAHAVVTGERFALCAVGPAGTAAAVVAAPYAIALQGHPTWRASGRSAVDPATLAVELAQAYASRGAGVLDDLGGDFALAIVDVRDGGAMLAVDRFAVRNLVYRDTGATLVFGATSDAVNAHPAVRATLDPQALYDYVYFHMVPGPRTIWRDNLRVLPAHRVDWSSGHLATQPWWTFRFDEDAHGGVEHFKPAFRRALDDGVRAYAAHEHCGAFLSGGTDSSTVAGLLGQALGRPPDTYSIGFGADGYDEMAYARIAARHFATRHHEYYVTPDDVVAALPLVAAACDQPFGNASIVPPYYGARRARADGIERLLGGDGGDELFGGNDRYAKQHQLALYGRLPAPARAALRALVHSMPGAGRLRVLGRAQSYLEQARLPMPERYETYNLLNRLGPHTVFSDEFLATVNPAGPIEQLRATWRGAQAGTLINRLLALDAKFTLADNDLPKVTRACELAGVDVAFPLLHESVVDFSRGLPPDYKLRGTRLRWFCKEARRDFLPAEIIAKTKHGFGLPAGVWLRDHPPLREMAGDALQGLRARRIFRGDLIDGLMSRRLVEHAGYYGTLAWVLMMLELWFRSRPGSSAPSS
jgi:asparagine synthase (glutamine-hydrolysing)